MTYEIKLRTVHIKASRVVIEVVYSIINCRKRMNKWLFSAVYSLNGELKLQQFKEGRKREYK